MARIKVVLARLIKVRKLNPVGDTVPDLLDRAHNAMDSKNIALAVETIKELPQNIQIPFHTFLEKTNGYIDAKAALDALVLSYTKGE